MHVSCIFMQLKGPLDRHTHSNTHTVTHTKSHTHRHWLWQNISLHGRCLCFALNCKPQRHLLEGGQARERVRVWEWPKAVEGEGGGQPLHTLNSPQSRKQNRQKCWAHCLDDYAVLRYLSRSLYLSFSLSHSAPTLAVAIFNWACNWCEQ